MNKFYITFGQSHAHSIDGKTLNKDTVAVIETVDLCSAFNKVKHLFGKQYFSITDSQPVMSYYPGGLIYI